MSLKHAKELPARGTDRRRSVLASDHNGLDSVEVSDDRRQLKLMFFERVPEGIGPANIRIDGPASQPTLTVTHVRRVTGADPQLRDHLLADLTGEGGEGTYRVRVVEAGPSGRPGTAPLRALDPLFTTSDVVRFNIDEPSHLPVGAPEPASKPPTVRAAAASYLARDYQGLRRLLLDRLAQTVPGISTRYVPDLMVTLVELFAYLGDDLSYYQDAVATEAYLATARMRTSVRRHSRLIGYPFHEGCHARAWIELQVSIDHDVRLHNLSLAADVDGRTLTFTPIRATLPPTYAAGETHGAQAQGRRPMVSLYKVHNGIQIWSWGERLSCLAEGATEATLAEPPRVSPTDPERSLQLKSGDVLLFEELLDKRGGPPDETHRHVVRLTRVERARDPLYDRAVLNVAWDARDALPFELPVNDASPVTDHSAASSVARANLVLVGEGNRISNEHLDPEVDSLHRPDLTWSCPYPDLDRVAEHQSTALKGLYERWRLRMKRWLRAAECGEALSDEQREELRRQLGEETVNELGLAKEPSPADDTERVASDIIGLVVLLERADDLLDSRRHRLDVLSRLAAASGPLSGPLLAEISRDWGNDLAQGLDTHHPAAWGPAVDATTQDPKRAQPLLALTDSKHATRWDVTTGLVDEVSENPLVAVEMDNDRTARLRFNRSATREKLIANYLVGNGAGGNVAAEAITTIASGPTTIITSVRNPLPATGGTDPETMDQARRAIPGYQLTNQPRALTVEDYVAVAETVPGVRNATAVDRWTGDRLRIRVAVQPLAGAQPEAALLHRVEQVLVVCRRIGHDVRVTAPDYRAVTITVNVHLDAFAIRDESRRQVAQVLSGGRLDDGKPAFFHPSRFSFGDPLYQSALIATVQDLPGVQTVEVTRMSFLRPQYTPTTDEKTEKPPTVLSVAPTAIIRCDNDPVSPQNGYVGINLVGGR